MRLIDADALKAKYEQMLPEIGDGYHKETLQDVLFELDYAPTISPDEVRGVVHCGECVHADKDMPGAIYCTMWDAWEVPEDGFCYKGAKMEVTSDA